jgi:hypothetical protein
VSAKTSPATAATANSAPRRTSGSADVVVLSMSSLDADHERFRVDDLHPVGDLQAREVSPPGILKLTRRPSSVTPVSAGTLLSIASTVTVTACCRDKMAAGFLPWPRDSEGFADQWPDRRSTQLQAMSTPSLSQPKRSNL